jgi:hypothetical protein
MPGALRDGCKFYRQVWLFGMISGKPVETLGSSRQFALWCKLGRRFQKLAIGKGISSRNRGRIVTGGSELATRRSVVLAASMQIISPLVASEAFAQTTPDKSAADDVALKSLPPSLRFQTPEEFGRFFRSLWELKLATSLAQLEKNAETEIAQLLDRAQKTLQAEFGGGNGTIPAEIIQKISDGTVYAQNIILSVSTNAKSGIVRITAERIRAMRDYYCSFYPYCR